MLAVAVVAGLDRRRPHRDRLAAHRLPLARVIERQAVVARPARAATTVPSPETARALAAGAAAAVVRISRGRGATKRPGPAWSSASDGAPARPATLVDGVEHGQVCSPTAADRRRRSPASDPAAGLAVRRSRRRRPHAAVARRARPSPATWPSRWPAARPWRPAVGQRRRGQLARPLGRTARLVPARDDRDRRPVPAPTAAPWSTATAASSGISRPWRPSSADAASPSRSTSPRASAIDLLEHGRARAAWLGIERRRLDDARRRRCGVDGGAEARRGRSPTARRRPPGCEAAT